MEDKIIRALHLTFDNIKSLKEDADILSKHAKFGHSYTLFCKLPL